MMQNFVANISNFINTSLVIKKALGVFPEGKLKNKVRAVFYNIKWGRKNIRFDYKNPYWSYNYYGKKLKFYLNNPFIDYPALKGFFARHKVKNGDTLVDVGAYTGLMSIISSLWVGEEGKVISIEADLENFRFLKKNIAANRIKNITLINKAIWSKKKKMKWYDGQDYNSNLFQKQNKTRNIYTSTIDEELKKRKIDKVDMIIMDVEGAEIEVVKGSRRTLSRNNVHLAIASYHTLNGQPTWVELEKLLRKIGYVADTGFETHLTTYAKKKNS